MTPSIGSSLPQDSCVFQWDRNSVAVRYHSRRIILWWAGRRHSRAVNVEARRAGQLANARHLLSDRTAAIDPIGTQLDSHEVRIEVMEIHLCLKEVLGCICLYLQVAKAERTPFLFQSMFPIDDVPPTAPLSAARSR